MKNITAAIVAILVSLPCVAQASLPAAYEAPDALCHDMAESAYWTAVARGDGLPDDAYESEMAACQYDALRAYMVASPDVSLNELIAFDFTDADDASLPYPH